MTQKDPLGDDARAGMKRWLDNWRRVGPLLEQERAERLAAMTAREVQDVTRCLLDLWQAGWKGDDGEALVLQQRVFARARTRG